jgi:putative NIF3 family GTP cyclohydrolase 1 type 2
VPNEIQGEAMACDVHGLSSTESSGLGRVGELHSPVSLREFAFQVKERLGLSYLRVAGDPELAVARVAVCSGSGSGLLKSFFSSNAQVYVSGDLHYHDARDVEASGRGLVDIGHFGSERIVGDLLVDRLQRAFDRKGMDAVAEACELETDPFILV